MTTRLSIPPLEAAATLCSPAEPSRMRRILLADDHSLFRAGMRCILARGLPDLAVDEADSFRQAIAAVTARRYDLVLMDLLMPNLEPLDGLRAVKGAAPETPLAVLSMLDGEAEIQQALAAGAAGFIPKASTPAVTCHAIGLILSGGVYLPPGILDRSPPPPDQPAARPAAGAAGREVDRLPQRQQEVLRELLLGKSNKEIARALNIAVPTVNIYIAALKKFFRVCSRTSLVLAAAGQGSAGPRGAPEAADGEVAGAGGGDATAEDGGAERALRTLRT